MSASLVGSEMCIRDRAPAVPRLPRTGKRVPPRRLAAIDTGSRARSVALDARAIIGARRKSA
eukprot:136800-Alexandrium_andersonii.AAC.1